MAEHRGSAADQVKALVEAAEAEASRAREGVGRVAERADQLGQRVDELAAGVAEALAALKAEIEELREGEPERRGRRPLARSRRRAVPEPEAPTVALNEPPATPEGARLLALKMALDGRPREETAGYLRENFELDDPEGLLDEVYARAGR